MSKMTVAVARKTFSDVISRAWYAKERITLTRNGKPVAAMLPIEDLELLEELENRRDAEAARKELAQFRASGQKPIVLAGVRKRRGP